MIERIPPWWFNLKLILLGNILWAAFNISIYDLYRRYECRLFGHQWKSWTKICLKLNNSITMDIPLPEKEQKLCQNCSAIKEEGS